MQSPACKQMVDCKTVKQSNMHNSKMNSLIYRWRTKQTCEKNATGISTRGLVARDELHVSLPLVIRNIVITPNLWFGQDVLPGLFLLLKGQQLCVALPLLLDGGLGSCFFLLLSINNAANTSVMREEKELL